MDDCCRLVLPFNAVHDIQQTKQIPNDPPRMGAKSTSTSNLLENVHKVLATQGLKTKSGEHEHAPAPPPPPPPYRQKESSKSSKRPPTQKSWLRACMPHISPGSTVYSDMWRSYEGYHHAMVNHSEEFVSAEDPLIHKQNIKHCCP